MDPASNQIEYSRRRIRLIGDALRLAPALAAPDTVHLWTFPLYRGEADHVLLSAEETQRANRFHFDVHRDRFIAGRAQLRRILGNYLGTSPQQITLTYSPSGKPAIRAPVPLAFNLSHSGNLAALAVARFEIGVDIEQIRTIDRDIAQRFFAGDEVATLFGLPDEQWNEAFFSCWTRKEAYLKATGDGLLVALDSFSVSLTPGKPAELLRVKSQPQEPAHWQFASFVPAPGFMGAIAARQRHWQVCRHAL
ncbi:MAG TPA: 4'-phosphopantetheinyl transferase superfamily protein [Acetobacteraceae bacterium]